MYTLRFSNGTSSCAADASSPAIPIAADSHGAILRAAGLCEEGGTEVVLEGELVVEFLDFRGELLLFGLHNLNLYIIGMEGRTTR
jgi:hypothetical protein